MIIKTHWKAVLLFLSIFFVSCVKPKFNSERWKEANDGFGSAELKAMGQDLVASHKLIGLTHKQMLDLLGENVNDSTSTWYTLEDNYDEIDPVSGTDLEIEFNKDSIITRAYIKEWHKH